MQRSGKHVHLGTFATADGAALCYARLPDAQAAAEALPAPPPPPPLMAEEVARQGEAEGLTLLRADNLTGYTGVSCKSGRAKPYEVKVYRGGKNVSLGYFRTAE